MAAGGMWHGMAWRGWPPGVEGGREVEGVRGRCARGQGARRQDARWSSPGTFDDDSASTLQPHFLGMCVPPPSLPTQVAPMWQPYHVGRVAVVGPPPSFVMSRAASPVFSVLAPPSGGQGGWNSVSGGKPGGKHEGEVACRVCCGSMGALCVVGPASTGEME